MALRPIAALSLLTFAVLAGCSDGPASGDLTAIPGSVTVEGTTVNTYVAEVRPASQQSGGTVDQCVPDDVPESPLDMGKCQDPSSTYAMHFMCLPEPSGEGYMVFQAGGSIQGEGKALSPLLASGTCQGGSMWDWSYTVEADESTTFERFEIRMGDFIVASAGSGSGSQAFTANPALSAVTVEGSYKGKDLTVTVGGLVDGVEYVGRLYTRSDSGNLTVAESFPVINGEQTLKMELADVGDYEEFHIHVGTSRIYVYQGTI